MGTLRTAAQYTRGSEVVSHYLAMFRASVARQSILVLVLSAVAGLGSVALEMGDARSHLPDYVDAWLREDVIAGIEREVVGRSRIAGGKRGDVKKLAPVFGHRSVPFLAKQAALRTAMFFVLGWPLLAVALIAVGKALRADKFLRGARLVDTTTRKYHRRHLRRAVTRGFGCAFVGALCVPLVASGGNGVGLLRLFLAWFAVRVSSVAALLSPEGDGAVIWTYARGHGGLLAPERSYVVLSDVVGWGVPGLGGLFLLGAVVGGIAGLVWARRSRLAEQPTDPQALRVGGVVIPRVCEVSHFLVSGVVRVGKTVFINWLLDTIRDRGQRAIVWDPKGEYTTRYYRPGKDIILNPFDERSACWTPWAEADDMAAYESMGRSLFPNDIAHDKFWAMGGALIFAWLVERVGKRLWSKTGRPMCECPHNQELAYVFNYTEMAELQQELEGSPAARYMSENAAAMSQSFLGTLATNLSPFLYLRNLRDGEEAFSIRDFVRDEASDAWLFISADPQRFDAVRPLVSLWYDLAINAALALPDNRNDVPIEKHRRIFAALDELASLQVLPALDPALTVGASKGLSLILGLQSLDQMKDTYGHHKAMTMLGQPQNRQVLRTVESTTAKWLEEELGKREIERTTESQQMGADAQRDGVGLAKQRHLESLVVYSQIQSLPKLTGYLSMAGEPVKKITYSWPPKRGDEPGLVPVTTLPEPTPPPWVRAHAMIEESEKLAREHDVDGAIAKAQQASALFDQDKDTEALHKTTQRIDALQRRTMSPDIAQLEAQLATAEGLRETASGERREHIETWAGQLHERLRQLRSQSEKTPNAKASGLTADSGASSSPPTQRVESTADQKTRPSVPDGHEDAPKTSPVAQALARSQDLSSKLLRGDLDLVAEMDAVTTAIEGADDEDDRERLREWAQALHGRIIYEAIKRQGGPQQVGLKAQAQQSEKASDLAPDAVANASASARFALSTATEQDNASSPSRSEDSPKASLVARALASAEGPIGRLTNGDLDPLAELETVTKAIEVADDEKDRARLKEWAQVLHGRIIYDVLKRRRLHAAEDAEAGVNGEQTKDDDDTLSETSAGRANHNAQPEDVSSEDTLQAARRDKPVNTLEFLKDF